jgi:hypothetical protein
MPDWDATTATDHSRARAGTNERGPAGWNATLASTWQLRLNVSIERRVAIVQERGEPHIVLDEDVSCVFRHCLAEVWIVNQIVSDVQMQDPNSRINRRCKGVGCFRINFPGERQELLRERLDRFSLVSVGTGCRRGGTHN